MDWNDDWREELETDYESCYIRLCECRNTAKDIVLMAQLMYRYNSGRTKKDCLDRMLDWVTDWNNQPNLYPDTEEEYNKMLSYL